MNGVLAGLVGAMMDRAGPAEAAGLRAGRADPAPAGAVVGVCAEQSFGHARFRADQLDERIHGAGRDRRRDAAVLVGVISGFTEIGATGIEFAADCRRLARTGGALDVLRWSDGGARGCGD